MGFYITCKYCGEESKGHISWCNCQSKKALTWQNIWNNSQVIQHISKFPMLFFHIRKDNIDHYFSMYLFEEFPSYNKITKDEFLINIEQEKQEVPKNQNIKNKRVMNFNPDNDPEFEI